MLLDYRVSGVPTRRITELLAYATDKPLTQVLDNVYSDPTTNLYLWIDEDREASGLIGWRVHGDALEVLHIAVDEERRNQGIGRRMIDAVVTLKSPRKIVAETDHDAVEFYRRCGFSIQSIGEKYPGVERFACSLPSSS